MAEMLYPAVIKQLTSIQMDKLDGQVVPSK